MSMPGPMEWVIIFLIVIVLFGAKRLPDLGKSVGKSLRDFKKAIAGDDEEKKESPNQNPPVA